MFSLLYIVDVHILWCTWGCSSWMWTGIRGDVISGKSPEWRHPEFRFTSNYCTPKCITGCERRLYLHLLIIFQLIVQPCIDLSFFSLILFSSSYFSSCWLFSISSYLLLVNLLTSVWNCPLVLKNQTYIYLNYTCNHIWFSE